MSEENPLLSMGKKSVETLRDSASSSKDRSDAFYILLILESITKGKITLADLGTTEKEVDDFSKKYQKDFFTARDELVENMVSA